MKNVLYLNCVICGQTYQPDEVDYVCPMHGNEGILDVVYDYAAIGGETSPETIAASRDYTIWRYRGLLPVSAETTPPPLTVGWTPLYQSCLLGLSNLYIKDDGRNPTGSFKDRASIIAVMKAREAGAETITTASSGNAAAALSGISASVGQKNVIFVPKAAPQAKIAQLLAYGSTVMLVDGTYDDAFDLCLEVADAYGWYNRNTGYNPYMTEGKKTVSFEIAEQLGWQAPDAVFVSVGDGCIIGGVHKGFKDLFALGWIDQMPRIYGIQAEGSNWLAEAWANDEDLLAKGRISAETAADSISCNLPRDRFKAMAAVRETGGAFITTSDADILQAIPELAQGSGVFAEPSGAAAYAGLKHAIHQKLVEPDEKIVVINTGNGLKDVVGAMKAVEQVGNVAYTIRPKLSAVKEIIEAV